MAVKYFHLAEALYYRILESIIEREKLILGNTDLSVRMEEGWTIDSLSCPSNQDDCSFT